MTKHYSEGVLGPGYRAQIPDQETGAIYDFPDPTSWCNSFLFDANKVLTGRLEYHGVIECVEYFVSCLRRIKEVRKAYVDDAFDLAEKANHTKSGLAKKFAEQMLARKDEITNAISNIPDSD